MNKQEYLQLIHKFLLSNSYVCTDDPILNYENLEGRLMFATMKSTYMKDHVTALKILLSIVRDGTIRLRSGDSRDLLHLLHALILLGKLNWQLFRNENMAQNYFEKAIEWIDKYPESSVLAGRIFYERSLILLDTDREEEAMNLGFELLDCFQMYGVQQKDKKMFYIHMALAAVAHNECINDIAVDHLWKAYQHIEEKNKTLAKFLRNQYKQRESDFERAYYLMHEHLELYL